jgi:hypothetical protein
LDVLDLGAHVIELITVKIAHILVSGSSSISVGHQAVPVAHRGRWTHKRRLGREEEVVRHRFSEVDVDRQEVESLEQDGLGAIDGVDLVQDALKVHDPRVEDIPVWHFVEGKQIGRRCTCIFVHGPDFVQDLWHHQFRESEIILKTGSKRHLRFNKCTLPLHLVLHVIKLPRGLLNEWSIDLPPAIGLGQLRRLSALEVVVVSMLDVDVLLVFSQNAVV